MKALINEIKWSDKPTLSKEGALLLAVVLAGILAYVRIRPMFDPTIHVVTAPEKADALPSRSDAAKVLSEVSPTTSRRLPVTGEKGVMAGGAGGVAKRDPNAPSVIERPLFDGLPVALRAVLLHAISSREPSSSVEVQVLAPMEEGGRLDTDLGPARSAKLVGTFSPNVALKRLNFAFTELISSEGRSYSVIGAAFDPETRSIGAVANYSSGLPTRLAGVALDRAIVAGDQIAMARIFSLGADSSTAGAELRKAMVETNQQATMSLSAEATKDLRETPAELSLPAGSIISIRVRASQSGGLR